MKREEAREKIVCTTQEMIVKNGIRAVRVDEIAQRMGISKRTLYETFADKNELIGVCMERMSVRQRKRISAYRRRRTLSPLQNALRLIYEYIDGICFVNSIFLEDVYRKEHWAQYFAPHKVFWRSELAELLKACQEDGQLLEDIQTQSFANKVFNTLLDMRIEGEERDDLYLFGRTILRGAATKHGVELIDKPVKLRS